MSYYPSPEERDRLANPAKLKAREEWLKWEAEKNAKINEFRDQVIALIRDVCKENRRFTTVDHLLDNEHWATIRRELEDEGYKIRTETRDVRGEYNWTQYSVTYLSW